MQLSIVVDAQAPSSEPLTEGSAILSRKGLARYGGDLSHRGPLRVKTLGWSEGAQGVS